MIKLIGKQWMLGMCSLAVLALQGCVSPGGFISEAKFIDLRHKPDAICDSQDPAVRQGCTAERQNSLAFAPLSDVMVSQDSYVPDMVYLELRGSGRCGELSIDFGDGSPIETYLDKLISNGPAFKHHYSGWPGKKIVRVIAGQNCTGSRTVEVSVGHKPDGRDVYTSFFEPNLSVCNQFNHVVNSSRQNMPPLRAGTTVRISTDGRTIQYGIPVFNASGDPITVTPATFPFPGRRVYSLVYRIGTTDIQGEAGPVIFRVPQTGPLEVCVNDHRNDLADNRGGMRIDILVNEGSATSP